MTKQLLKDALGWGSILWLIGYLLGIVLFPLVPQTLLGWYIMPVGILMTLWVLLKKIKAGSFQYYLFLAIIWTLIAIVFDYFFLVKVFKPEDGYYKLDVYLYYVLTLFLPLLVWWRKSTGKGLAFSILLVFIGLAGIFFFRDSDKGNENLGRQATPSVTVTSQDRILKEMYEDFSKKYNRPTDAFLIALDSVVGNYAKGSVTFKGEGGGGLWFATNVSGVWQIVYDGNGIILCSHLTQYPDFPSKLIPHCFDDNKNELIER